MKTKMAAAGYHPRILSPKYGQTASVKRLTANRRLPFAVSGKMAKSIFGSLMSALPGSSPTRPPWPQGRVGENHGNEVALMFHWDLKSLKFKFIKKLSQDQGGNFLLPRHSIYGVNLSIFLETKTFHYKYTEILHLHQIYDATDFFFHFFNRLLKELR